MKTRENKNGYWFYIESYAHLSIKKNDTLLYNPLTGKILTFIDNPLISQLMRRLALPQNMYTIHLTDRDLRQPDIRQFVQSVRDNFIGDLIDVSSCPIKPIQVHPIMKIQQDANILKKGTQRSIGEDIMAYLSDLWLYVNGNCTQDCSICRDAYRQFNFCTSSREKNLELSIADIKRIVEELPPGIPQNIHILGGNILSYAHLVNLLELIPADCRTSLYIHYLNADRHKEKIQHISKHNITLELLFSFPLIKEKAYRAIQALKEPGIDFRFSFSIRNTGEFEEANELIQLNPEIGATFHPLFDGTNIDFFSENIFVKAEEIERIKPSLKEVHSRGIVNPNYFGNLIIRPDGRVYADVNAPSLGKIQENSIFDILVKEVESGTSWRKVRKNVLPCKSCVFEKLCPPISNYNTAVGRFDLCSIRRQASQKKIK